MLAQNGIHRGLLFELQPELLAIMPKREDCTPERVVEAMKFLTDEWLCDVPTDYAGKCILIAALASILERVLLPERPAFFVTGGRRGGGKTTTLRMVLLASTGLRAPAAAWSPNEEERRKTLFAYLSEGVPAVVWDNIPRGLTIHCSAIERSLTSASYSDRVLGKSETRTAPATTINFFTGNNIAPRGDLSSRSLKVRLTVDRVDPEERQFKHADPIAWTIEHRSKILQAIYTILFANPRLGKHDVDQAETRFKTWWHLVGSAIEHAAKEVGEKVHFRDLFQDSESDDEQSNDLATVLNVMAQKWPTGARAVNIANFAQDKFNQDAVNFLKALEGASGKLMTDAVSLKSITWRLKALIDGPVDL